jgi:hypothetical protein
MFDALSQLLYLIAFLLVQEGRIVQLRSSGSPENREQRYANKVNLSDSDLNPRFEIRRKAMSCAKPRLPFFEGRRVR